MLAKLACLAPLSCWLMTVALAQTQQGAVLKGTVILNEVGGAPVVGVNISASGANDTTTVAGGKFTLRFPNMKSGEPVEVRVSRPGYVVVNWIQQNLNLPDESNREELTLIVCKETEREIWALSFYRLKGRDAVDEEYEQRIRKLEANNRASADQIAQLQRERDEARTAEEEMAEKFARVKPGDATDLYAQAMSLFVQGRTADALALLDKEKLDAELSLSEQKVAQARLDLMRTIQEYLLRAELLTTQFNSAFLRPSRFMRASRKDFQTILMYRVLMDFTVNNCATFR